MASGFRAAGFPLGLANAPAAVTAKGYRSLLAFWMGGAGTFGVTPPTPPADTQPSGAGNWNWLQRQQYEDYLKRSARAKRDKVDKIPREVDKVIEEVATRQAEEAFKQGKYRPEAINLLELKKELELTRITFEIDYFYELLRKRQESEELIIVMLIASLV